MRSTNKNETMTEMRELAADDLIVVQGGFLGTVINNWAQEHQAQQTIKNVATVVIGVLNGINPF